MKLMPPPVIDSQDAYRAAVAWGFETAIGIGARRIVCADTDFAIWPWDEPATLTSLTAWLRLPQRSLVLLARDFDTVPRLHPRFNRWRRDWAHAIFAWQAPADWTPDIPSLLVADRDISVQLIDCTRWRGRARADERTAQDLRMGLDVVLQRSEPAFAVRTLGL
jgi:hypothetical protein